MTENRLSPSEAQFVGQEIAKVLALGASELRISVGNGTAIRTTRGDGEREANVKPKQKEPQSMKGC